MKLPQGVSGGNCFPSFLFFFPIILSPHTSDMNIGTYVDYATTKLVLFHVYIKLSCCALMPLVTKQPLFDIFETSVEVLFEYGRSQK